MQIEMDVTIGDVIQIGEHVLIVLEGHDHEVTFKLCHRDEWDESPRPGWSRPR